MTTDSNGLEAMLQEAGSNSENDWEQNDPTTEEQAQVPEEPTAPPTVQGQVAVDEAREEFSAPRVRPNGASSSQPVATDVETASSIIRVLDALRSLDSVKRDVATHLVAQGKEITTEADTVLAVMSAPSNLVRTVRALLEARSLDPVDRAFFLVKLERPAARNMATLVSAFRNDVELPSDHIELARVLVVEIGELTEDDIDNVEATESLFAAYENEGGADSQ